MSSEYNHNDGSAGATYAGIYASAPTEYMSSKSLPVPSDPSVPKPTRVYPFPIDCVQAGRDTANPNMVTTD